MKGTDTVEYNGKETQVKDIPDPMIRYYCGYGHYNPYNRQVVPHPDGRKYPFTPDTCEWADDQNNEWINDGQTLVCLGCGIDGT